MKAEEIQEQMPAALRDALGADRVSVDPASVRRLAGGAVHETWSVDAVVELPGQRPEAQRMVLRAYPLTGPRSLTAEQEFNVLRAGYDAGVPVPRPLVVLNEGLSLTGFMMERVDAETIGRRLITQPAYAEARRVLTGQLGRALATIHRIPVTATLQSFLRAPEHGVSPALTELRRLEETYRTITPDPHPAYELGLRWLAKRLPESGEPTFVHGDFRVGNVMFGPEGLRSVIDWEGAHIGDPAEDLGWLCIRSWRFGGPHPVGGVGTREELLQAYTEAGGAPVDEERLRWWEVFGNLRWAVAILTILEPFLTGDTKDIEPGSIGRRAVEVEYDLLELIANEA